MKKLMCKKYPDSEALPNERGKCSLCNGKCLEQKPKTFTVKFQVEGQIIDDILCTAFEGGSNYWADHVEIKKRIKGVSYASEMISKGGILVVHEQEANVNDDPKHTLDLDKMLKGIALYMENGGELDPGMDAGEADQVLQYALFGKLIYG